MDEQTAAFPDSFEESKLGLVPAGWEVKTIGEITDYLSRGISPKLGIVNDAAQQKAEQTQQQIEK